MSRSLKLSSLACAALLGLAGCMGISKAKEGTPRVELELQVAVADAFKGRLQGLDAEFTRAVTELVLAKADVGLRFYPTLSERYKGNAPRPPYLMRVAVRDLTVGTDFKTTKKEGADPVVTTWVSKLDTDVSIELVKRRDAGPELTVGSAQQGGSTAVAQPSTESKETTKTPAGPSYAVKREAGQQPLTASRADLLKSIDAALERSLKALVEPIDRDLAAPSR